MHEKQIATTYRFRGEIIFHEKMESFRGEDAEVIPEKKKPLTKDERLCMLGTDLSPKN